MLRPSKLGLAEQCRLSADLGDDEPTTSDAAENGTAIHDEISWAIQHGREPSIPQAVQAVGYFRELVRRIEAQVYAERQLVMLAVDGMSSLLQGTADLVVHQKTIEENFILVLDWKTGQRSHVAPARDNLQLHAYGVAAMEEFGASKYKVSPVFLGENAVWDDWSEWMGEAQAASWRRRIEAIAAKPSVANPGDHCSSCYARHKCHAWRDTVSTALAALGPDDLTLTDDRASELAAKVDLAEDWIKAAKAAIKGYAESGGNVILDGKRYVKTMQPGRESWDVDALKRDGLYERYRKPGLPFERWDWRRIG